MHPPGLDTHTSCCPARFILVGGDPVLPGPQGNVGPWQLLFSGGGAGGKNSCSRINSTGVYGAANMHWI